MSRYKRMTLTSKGWQMLAKMMKRECDMVVTRAAIGCGSYDGTEDLSLAEGLKGFIRSFGISSFEREDDQLLLRFVASNFDLETNVGNETDYYLTEIGIYARESGADEDFLYAIAVADVPAFLPAYDEASPVTITFSTYVYIGNEGDVLIHADPTAYAMAADLRAHEQNEGNPHKVTKKQVGLEYADNTPDLEKPVSEAQRQAIADAQAGAKQFTLQKIADLINGAPETLDTLKEVADAIAEHNTVMEALDAAVGKKANQSDLGNGTVTIKQAGASKGTFTMNQSGNTTIELTDSDTKYTHPTSAGNKHIPAGGSSGQILRWSADGTATWGADNNTKYGAATQSAQGLMSANDKTKLDGIASGANAYSLPAASTTVRGGVKTGYTANGKNYPVQLSNEQMYVNVPWTDTNTWRGIQNNLTSDSTNESLSAAQGKALKALVDGKAASSHTHSYLPLSGGTVTGDETVKGKFATGTSKATNTGAAAFGTDCTSSGENALSAGSKCTSGAKNTIALGTSVDASLNYGVGIGFGVFVSYFQMAIGSFNTKTEGPSSQGAKSGTAFIIGNGTSATNRSNAFRITGAGAAYACSAFNSSGADYAEFFEWEDGNVDAEDRRGYFVTLCGDKIKLAEPGDYILGVVSAHPTVIGNSDEGWTGRYVTDEFGSYIEEIYEYDEVSVDENGEETTTRKTGITWKQNPDYDPEMTYIQRADRAEWDAVGMMGVLPVRDDGSCEVNGYCTVAEGGIATACSRSASPDVYRVIERSGDNVVKIVVK